MRRPRACSPTSTCSEAHDDRFRETGARGPDRLARAFRAARRRGRATEAAGRDGAAVVRRRDVRFHPLQRGQGTPDGARRAGQARRAARERRAAGVVCADGERRLGDGRARARRGARDAAREPARCARRSASAVRHVVVAAVEPPRRQPAGPGRARARRGGCRARARLRRLLRGRLACARLRVVDGQPRLVRGREFRFPLVAVRRERPRDQDRLCRRELERRGVRAQGRRGRRAPAGARPRAEGARAGPLSRVSRAGRGRGDRRAARLGRLFPRARTRARAAACTGCMRARRRSIRA